MPQNFNPDIRLPFKTRKLEAHGRTVEEYLIPAAMKRVVFEILYPFRPVPRLGEVLYDLHEEKLFVARDYMVIRDMGMNLLVSPYYASSGGMVIDWAPADRADENEGPRGYGYGGEEGDGVSRTDGVRESTV